MQYNTYNTYNTYLALIPDPSTSQGADSPQRWLLKRITEALHQLVLCLHKAITATTPRSRSHQQRCRLGAGCL
jgi:hypothetical protein